MKWILGSSGIVDCGTIDCTRRVEKVDCGAIWLLIDIEVVRNWRIVVESLTRNWRLVIESLTAYWRVSLGLIPPRSGVFKAGLA